MKKSLFLLLGFLISVTMLAEEKNDTVINQLKYHFDGESSEWTLVDGTGVTIPKIDFVESSIEVDGISYDVTAIGENAFKNNKSINHVVIPDKIKVIEKNAFNGCSAIRLLEFPSSITDVNSSAFSGCSSIEFE